MVLTFLGMELGFSSKVAAARFRVYSQAWIACQSKVPVLGEDVRELGLDQICNPEVWVTG